MKIKSIVLTGLSVIVITALIMGCASVPKPTEKNFKTPVVTLNYVDVAHYFGWWFYSPKVKPTKGKAGYNAAPLDFAFIFDINNPNPFPVLLDGFKFATVLDGYEINSGYSTEAQWIPAGKTNQIKVEVMYDVRGTMLSLLIVAGQKMKDKGVGMWDQLEKIWVGAPDFSYPVGVVQGSAVFKADDLTKVAAFSGTYP